MAITILLADDHQIVRQGLRAILEAEHDFHLAGEAADGVEALRQVEALRPRVLVLDLMMPGLNGLDVARRLAHSRPQTRIVVLSMHSDPSYVAEAFRAGALGYVLKDSSADRLVAAIRAVAAGERYLCPPFTEATLGQAESAGADPFEGLSTREREVLQMTVDGLSGVEISEKLTISPRTVESHRVNLMRKLGVRNQKELVRLAVQRGILTAKNAIDPVLPTASEGDDHAGR